MYAELFRQEFVNRVEVCLEQGLFFYGAQANPLG